MAMFGRSPLADIACHLTTVPVDIHAIALQGDPVAFGKPDTDTGKLPWAEQRYRRAIALASQRLVSDSPIRASADHYLIELINHHARSIMMPRHLVLAVSVDGIDAVSLAGQFEVPVDVAERRLRDTDLRQLTTTRTDCSLSPAVQKASR
jgi:hypothetical protein